MDEQSAELTARILDKQGTTFARINAIKEAVEVFAPDKFDDYSFTPAEQQLIDAITQVAVDKDEESWLLNEAGDALGLSWIWRRAFDDETYAKMAGPAQWSARRVIGEADYGEWLPPDDA